MAGKKTAKEEKTEQPSKKIEIERLRANVTSLEESLNARGSEVIALRVALEARDKTIEELREVVTKLRGE